jgi:glycosyltransferase involved in cell wall biosynthesis
MRAVMLQNGFSADKMHMLPLFPTHQNPDPEPPLARSQSGIILLAGRLTRLKGWTHLVPAMAMASKKLGRTLTLAIAGDGPDRLKLLALAEHYQVPVQWYGWLSPEDITAKMRQADLLAVPSLWPEPFGLVGIEAGCVGTPAVAYAVGGIPDWLIHGVSGEMAPAEMLHPAPLADAIFRAIGNTSHWQNLRKGAYRQAQLFSANQHIQNLIAILAGR